jgi:hypothetical protein
VIGVGDTYTGRFDLANFARSAGTEAPLMVQDGNFVQEFVDAVRKIAGSNIACDFAIPPPPPGLLLNPDRVQLVHTPVNSAPEEIPKLASSAVCARSPSGGFYYDDPAQPRRIHVCPCTCARLAAGRVELRFGCRPLL